MRGRGGAYACGTKRGVTRVRKQNACTTANAKCETWLSGVQTVWGFSTVSADVQLLKRTRDARERAADDVCV
eukprot:4389731-Pleurochrysis_carterae.AAC.1